VRLAASASVVLHATLFHSERKSERGLPSVDETRLQERLASRAAVYNAVLMKRRSIARQFAVAALGGALACTPSEPAQGQGSVARAAADRAAIGATRLDTARLTGAYTRAAELPRLRSLLVEWRGVLVGERYFRGATRTTPANIKSASKSVISALVGIAIARGDLQSTEQTVGELLPAETRGLDSAKRAITVEDLLTMRTGLESTSFWNYGRFVSSRNWVSYALNQPVIAPRGVAGPMIYSTGSTHILSAILTRATGMSTHRYAERFLTAPLGIRLRPWTTDPQGIYFGGNEMRMTPREMLAFGRMYLNGGRVAAGAPGMFRQVLPKTWIDSSWVARTRSSWSGHEYGYGWWIRSAWSPSGRHAVYYAWGYGGQFIFVVPSLDLVVVATSDAETRSREQGHLEAVHSLLDQEIVPAVGG
jgi:CubicO group peptidase (beta-lactamase class C family)